MQNYRFIYNSRNFHKLLIRNPNTSKSISTIVKIIITRYTEEQRHRNRPIYNNKNYHRLLYSHQFLIALLSTKVEIIINFQTYFQIINILIYKSRNYYRLLNTCPEIFTCIFISCCLFHFVLCIFY